MSGEPVAQGEPRADDEVLGFLKAVWVFDHALRARSRRMEADLGVTGPQRLVIRILGRQGDSTPGAIARALSVHPSTLTGVLHRLDQGGLVTRHGDPADRRRAVISLTERGREADRLRAGTVEEVVRAVLEETDPADAERTAAVLDALARALLAE